MAESKQTRTEKYTARFIEALGPHVDGEVQAIGTFSRPGAMGRAVRSAVGGAGLFAERRAKKRAGGLPPNVSMALTASTLYAFEVRPRMNGSYKVKSMAASWPRQAVRVQQVGESTLSRTYRFSIAGAEPIDLDANRIPGFPDDFNDPLINALSSGNAA